jgi:4-hydroxy-4-methyl-2-oxoglutarate aldolase
VTINTDFARPSVEQIEQLSAFPTPTLYEALGQTGAAPSYIRPIYQGMKIAGAALTIECPPHDNLSIHAAVAKAQRGDLLIVDYKGFLESGPFGDVLATACQKAGIAGLAIDGCVRDGEQLREMGFSVFARGLCIKSASKTRMGRVGEPILFAGIPVMPGDAVIGDDDGLVVIPRGQIDAVIKTAQAREDKEAEMRAQLRAGVSTVELLDLARHIEGN